jgi:hypothetical protein
MMLYDKRWDKTFEVKADPFSLESLIAWLEKQPADKQYCYLDNGNCLHCQYFTAMGFENVHAFGFAIYHGKNPMLSSMGQDDAIENGGRLSDQFVDVAVLGRHTFGAALDRAREALSVTTGDAKNG